MPSYFSDYFGVDPRTIEEYGAFNVSLITDLPLFIDPFLLFNSKTARYKELHDEMIRYLVFLRNKARDGSVPRGILESLYRFPEVKQTWLGFSLNGNRGSGLGKDFANALHENLHTLFQEFGQEKVTQGSHLEKLCLIREGVGRDNVSDFTTNLIKGFLCEYTQSFAIRFLRPDQRRVVSVPKVEFNYGTQTWMPGQYELPWVNGDYVLLTPKDILTKDETWINKTDLVEEFDRLPAALPNEQLRAHVSNYFEMVLVRHEDKEPTKKDRAEAARKTILHYPELIDHYIRFKEERGDSAERVSSERVRVSEELFIHQIQTLQSELFSQTGFYSVEGSTYDEAHTRIQYLKDVIENKGGHRIFYIDGVPIKREEDIHILYRLVWFGTPSDVSREVNDGRGPADFKISRGFVDKTIVEFKLAKNTQLKRNLERQTQIYQKASDARRAIKVILFFSDGEFARVKKILKELGLQGSKDVVLIDACADNKPSGSVA